MSIENKLRITEIQRFCMHDGPGIRTTVFFKGCPLRCEWCHNPETQSALPELLLYNSKCIGCGECASVCPRGLHVFSEDHGILRCDCIACGECASACPTSALEICGAEYTPEELLRLVRKDVAFYGERGGVTLSGGEPLLQGEATVEFLRVCRESGLSTAVETCGYVDADVIKSAARYTDLFLWDVKDTDEARHKKYTGVSNENILNNLRLADALGAVIRIRAILVNGVNTDETHYRALAELAVSLRNCEGVELIPYHAYGGTKATFIGRSDNGRREWIPSDEQIAFAKRIISEYGVSYTLCH